MRHRTVLLCELAMIGATVCLAGCFLNKLEGGGCSRDDDCKSGETCLFDLTRAASVCARGCAAEDAACKSRCDSNANGLSAYCTKACQKDDDCPSERMCVDGTDVAESGSTETKLCVDRVRSCEATERCNGLDDDCDGAVDGPNCAAIQDCLDDVPCGAFVCVPPSGAATSMCAPRNANAMIADYAPCTDGSQCRNGLCETGYCSPLCRGLFSLCRSDFFCARAAGPKDRPPHNTCQIQCMTTSDCRVPGQRCVWRDVYQGSLNHAFVCSFPGSDRKPLGSACSGNNAQGDDECEDGLCYRGVCTRSCAGAGSDCSDVGANFTCANNVILIYGDQPPFASPLCVRAP